MRVAITSLGSGMEAQFSPRFARCARFIIVDTETREWEALTNPATDTGGGAGPQAVQFIASQDVEGVISGRFGPKAYSALMAAGIQTFVASSGTVSEVFEEFLHGELKQANAASGPGLHGGGRHR